MLLSKQEWKQLIERSRFVAIDPMTDIDGRGVSHQILSDKPDPTPDHQEVDSERNLDAGVGDAIRIDPGIDITATPAKD